MINWLRPKEKLDEREIKRGLGMLMADGMCSQVMGVFTGGAFLVAFALLLGASNFVIGLLAAIGPFTQILQIPAIFLVDRTGWRKALVVISSFFSRIFWVIVAFLPWLVPAEQRVAVMLICLFLYFGLGTISGCAFNSWMRDFIPENIMGAYFAKRMAFAVAIGAVLTLLAGFGVDLGQKYLAEATRVYTILFLLGAGFGLAGVFFLSQIPEPKMKIDRTRGLFSVLAEPFKDMNFRLLFMFLGSWNFAINLAAPFFTVYMIQRLGISLSWVLGLSVLSQLVNVLFLRLWGRMADRFSNKSVLGVSGPLFIICIILWPFTTMPERYFLTFPLLILIHVLTGISTAGVNLCSSNIALKLAPRGKATAYLATNALVNGIAATVAPIIAGISADWFSSEELSLSLRWTTATAETARFEIPAFNLRGLDFVFVISFLLGAYALHRLVAVREEGEVEEKIVTTQLFNEVRKAVRHVSNVAGLRALTYFPYARLKDAMKRNNRNSTS
jgi:MFS family permease